MASQEELFQLVRDLRQEVAENYHRLSKQISDLQVVVDAKIDLLEKKVDDHERNFKSFKVLSIWVAGVVTTSGITTWALELFKIAPIK